eukprot:gene25899-biopygen11510
MNTSVSTSQFSPPEHWDPSGPTTGLKMIFRDASRSLETTKYPNDHPSTHTHTHTLLDPTVENRSSILNSLPTMEESKSRGGYSGSPRGRGGRGADEGSPRGRGGRGAGPREKSEKINAPKAPQAPITENFELKTFIKDEK